MTGLGADRAAANAVGGGASGFTAQRVLGALPRPRGQRADRARNAHDHHHQGGVPGRGHRHHLPRRPALLRLPTAWAPSRAAPAPWGRQWAYGTATSSRTGRTPPPHTCTAHPRGTFVHHTRPPTNPLTELHAGPCFCSASSRPSAAGLVSGCPRADTQAPARVVPPVPNRVPGQAPERAPHAQPLGIR